MPRYYFHILDGTALTDETGVEFPGIALPAWLHRVVAPTHDRRIRISFPHDHN